MKFRAFLTGALSLWSFVILAVAGEAAAGSKINSFRGRQQRAGKFEFASKPQVSRQGDKYVVTFAATAPCDATVAIVDSKGKVVRHLAGGVLGRNAPWPFTQNSLSQSVEWDGKDDPKDLKSPLADPELGFLDPSFVAVTDEALYVHDSGNERIVRAKLDYHAEETVNLP